MSEYEKWNLALTAIGHLFVASSIIYAARQWLIAQRSYDREIIKETRQYLSRINKQIQLFQSEIKSIDLRQLESSKEKDDSIQLNKLLNTIESKADELENDFYCKKMIEGQLNYHAKLVWYQFQPYIAYMRKEKSLNSLWEAIENHAKNTNESIA